MVEMITSITFNSNVSVEYLRENHLVEEYGDYGRLNRRLVDKSTSVLSSMIDNYFQNCIQF